MDHVSCSRSCLRIHYSPASAGLLTITDTLWPYKRPEKDAEKKKKRKGRARTETETKHRGENTGNRERQTKKIKEKRAIASVAFVPRTQAKWTKENREIASIDQPGTTQNHQKQRKKPKITAEKEERPKVRINCSHLHRLRKHVHPFSSHSAFFEIEMLHEHCAKLI